jgi:hypothetical protein
MNQSQKGLAQFLISRRNTAKLFEVIEEPFHLLTQLVEGFIIVARCSTIALWRYHRHDVLRDELLSDAIAVIPLVHNRMGQRRLRRHLREHGLKDRTLMTVPCGQDDRDARAFIATAGMDFGGPAAPRAAQSLCGVAAVFFNAPAAC